MSNLVEIQLNPNQPPLGTQFKSYELNKAINYYLLDPFQYSITKFNYANPKVVPGAFVNQNNNNDSTINSCI